MKRIISIVGVVLAGILISTFVFAEEEDDLLLKRNRIGVPYLLNWDLAYGSSEINLRGPAMFLSNPKDDRTKKDILDEDFKIMGDIQQQENEAVVAAKNDLCERLGIKYKKIKDFHYELGSSMGSCDIPQSLSTTKIKIGLVYKKDTYIYEGYLCYSQRRGESWAEDVEFTGVIIPAEYDEKGNLILESSRNKLPIIESWRGNDFVSQLTDEQKKRLAELQQEYNLTIYEGESKSNDLIVLSADGEQIAQIYTFMNDQWADQVIEAIEIHYEIPITEDSNHEEPIYVGPQPITGTIPIIAEVLQRKAIEAQNQSEAKLLWGRMEQEDKYKSLQNRQ